ncbi:hypothetical protein EJ08DRAFT_195849 [Tothia fuscella]|uniref:Basic proline-rich protein n=1 Tax=Tothia fuscella TaxID=1048955 RepID=A0A9P4TYC6_9PEZI|nr:hypothetical protein EJ08DRAFT_195849 [Tothia fuscella]
MTPLATIPPTPTPTNMYNKPQTPPPKTPPTLNASFHSSDMMDKLQHLSLSEENNEEKMFELRHPRPQNPSTFLQPTIQLPKPPRTRSPYSRSHLRSQSSLSSLNSSAPPMLRTHSSPAFTSPQFIYPPGGRSSSPLRSPKRVRSPFRVSSDESTYNGSSAVSDIESIDEDHELDITPRPSDHRSTSLSMTESAPLLQAYHSQTFPRTSRRRPASPLHQVLSVPFGVPPASAPSSAAQSPLLSATKFNESFPGELTYSRSFSSSISSMPSTPTSARSRSPSISSLETIPDSPDAEEEAIESDKLDRLRRDAEAGDTLRRSSLEGRGSGGSAARDKRKRWSVCGAEKRSDLNLETIWED